MANVPTDREILQAVYDRYHQQFTAYDPGNPDRVAKILIPIDCLAIAHDLGGVDPDIVFGRLYYHLEQKHGYDRPPGRVSFFALEAGGERHCVNFPLLTSVLAGLQEERDRHVLTLWLSIASIVVSLIAIVVAGLVVLFTTWWKP